MNLTVAPPLTDQADDIERVWNAVLVAAIVVGVLVVGLVCYIVMRYRRRSSTLPRQLRENIPVEIAYTIVPLLIVAALFTVTFVSVRAIDDVADAEDTDLVVDVTAFQWQWRFEYPDGAVTITGTDDVIPELVLPASSTVRFELHAVDVIHSFWIPGFRFKRDMFPGRTGSFSVDVGEEIGTYAGLCAEFCGLDHHKMDFAVRVVPADDFERWLDERRSEAGA